MDIYYTPNEAALFLRVDVQTVRRYILEGKLSCVYLPGGDMRLTMKDIKKVLTPFVPGGG